jgi:hypothetical protein
VITEVSNTQPDQPKKPAKPRRIRRWNDQAYRNFINTCAEDLGLSIHALYKRAGVDPSNHSREASENGRSIEQILANADAAEKAPALFIAAGSIDQIFSHCDDLEVAKLAFVSGVAAHLYAALSQPGQLPRKDIQKLLKSIVSSIELPD